MIRVLVVDDQPLIRQAVTNILGAAPDVEVVGSGADGREGLAAARALLPDVVVMDVRMPVLDGIEATAAIRADAALDAVRVLVLTTFEEDAVVLGALRAGASAFLGKGAEPDEIVRAVRAVHAGDALLSPVATRGLIERALRTPVPTSAAPPDLGQLTDREREVLLLVGRGAANQDIADRLVISPHTAKTHVNRIMTKLGAHDRAQLVIAAYESGLLQPGA